MMESLYLQIDDLRECRQAWIAYEEYWRDECQYRRQEWPGYEPKNLPRGVFEIDLDE